MLEDEQPCPSCASRRQDSKNGQIEGCDPTAHSLPVALLRTNRQINTEARSVLYQQKFRFAYEKDLYFFLATIGHGNRKLLEKLQLQTLSYSRGLKGYAHPAFTLLADATSLKSFYLATPDPRSAKQLYSIMYFWLCTLVGRGSVWDVFKLHPSINDCCVGGHRSYASVEDPTKVMKEQIESLMDFGRVMRIGDKRHDGTDTGGRLRPV